MSMFNPERDKRADDKWREQTAKERADYRCMIESGGKTHLAKMLSEWENGSAEIEKISENAGRKITGLELFAMAKGAEELAETLEEDRFPEEDEKPLPAKELSPNEVEELTSEQQHLLSNIAYDLGSGEFSYDTAEVVRMLRNFGFEIWRFTEEGKDTQVVLIERKNGGIKGPFVTKDESFRACVDYTEYITAVDNNDPFRSLLVELRQKFPFLTKQERSKQMLNEFMECKCLYDRDPLKALLVELNGKYRKYPASLKLDERCYALGSRGGFSPREIEEYILPAFAKKMGVKKEAVRLPTSEECLLTGSNIWQDRNIIELFSDDNGPQSSSDDYDRIFENGWFRCLIQLNP